MSTAPRPAAGGKIDPSTTEESITWTSLRPTLYLDIIGTLVLQEGNRYRLAPFAREFVQTVKNDFELKFLCELSPAGAAEIAELVNADIEYVHWKKGLGKVTGIDFSREFVWIDDCPCPRDLMRLSEERCSSSLISVNGKDGVTRVTLDKIKAAQERLVLS